MDVTITPAEVTQKTTKSGKPYLNVKTEKGKYMNAWQETQYIWHKIKVGEAVVVSIIEDGKFITIIGMPGIEPPEQSGGTTVAKWPENASQSQNQPLNATGQNAWDRLWLRLDKLDEKIQFLIEEKMTLNSLKAQEINLHHPLPNLSDLPEHNLD